MDEILTDKYLKEIDAKAQKFIDEQKLIHEIALPPKQIPDRMHNTNNFPNEPVTPSTLSSEVAKMLESFGNIVSEKTPTMVEELCRSFNECIRLNNIGESQTLILSPKTGSAKSISAQMYISLLQEHASIIVVYTIEDAIETCKNINKWSGDNNYAKCTYKITDKNKKTDYWVNRNDLSKYRCIVISHELFKLANSKLGIDDFSKYKKDKRKFVLVDERIDLYKTIKISVPNISYLLKLFNDIKKVYPLSTLDNDISYLERTIEKLNQIQEIPDLIADIKNGKVKHRLESKRFMYIDAQIRSEYELNSYDFSNFYKLINDRVINLLKILDPLSLFNKEDGINIRQNLKNHLENLVTILKYNFYYFPHTSDNSGAIIMVTKNILNDFGSSIVLDATATVNRLYDDKVFNNPKSIKHLEATNPRVYTNFTINKCGGVPQGKFSIYESLANEELDKIITLYTNIATSLLTAKEDKLLIIAHKDFREMLEKTLINKSIKFTHWGDHRGKNKWSDCNKILVIGWNYLPSEVHSINYINAVNKVEHLSNNDFKEIKYNYSVSQIVDDLVQAVNRGAVRKTISKDGNCEKSEVYLFYPNNKLGIAVMKKFEDEFNGANVVEWNPHEIEPFQQLSKDYPRIKRIADYIDKKLQGTDEIKQPEVKKYFSSLKDNKISKSAFHRNIQNEEFKVLLQEREIEKIKPKEGYPIFKKHLQ